jgi:DNA-binding transcriptional ArsR family regulator
LPNTSRSITTSLARLEADAPHIAAHLKLFANEQRIRIVWRLAAAGELSGTALAEGLRISQSALSQHLAKLRKGGFVAVRRMGQRCLYRADPAAARLAIGLRDIVAK